MNTRYFSSSSSRSYLNRGLLTLFALAIVLATPLSAGQVTLRVDVNGAAHDIVIELDEKNAPKTSSNFKKLAASGFYDGIAFHRVIPNYIVQAGDPLTKNVDQQHLWGTGGPGYTIPAEIGLPHERGSIAMARLGDAQNSKKASSGSQFYIALARLPKLDNEYTVFGKVVSGMEYLDQISKVSADGNNNPDERIEIVASSAGGKSSTASKSSPVKVAAPAASAKMAKKDGSKKESWLKRKFSGKKKKDAEKMAAASEEEESTPAPTPISKTQASKAEKTVEKKTASVKKQSPLPATTPASGDDLAANNADPSYRNDNRADKRSALLAAPSAVDPSDATQDADASDSGPSLSDQMKGKRSDKDVDIREQKERGFFGRLLYRYW
ncbi:MAG: peptidylprolyl isomerase [Verrucomicrobiales bacterium]|nr:peptidylprolyl isomerase [Verrucomicrobiales bacterium]